MISCIDTSERIVVVSADDPAIDREATGDDALRKYITSGDMSLVKFRPGERATEFVLRPLDSAEDRRALTTANREGNGVDGATTVALFHELFAAGCVEIRSLFKPGDIVAPTPETVRKLPASIIREMGARIILMSRRGHDAPLGEDEGK